MFFYFLYVQEGGVDNMSDSMGVTLEELASCYCVLMRWEPSPENIKKALDKLKRCLDEKI